jgi:hypothetical protein
MQKFILCVFVLLDRALVAEQCSHFLCVTWFSVCLNLERVCHVMFETIQYHIIVSFLS